MNTSRLYSGILRTILGLVLVTSVIFFSQITIVIIHFLENFSPNKSLSVDTGFLIQFIFAIILVFLALFIILTFTSIRKKINESVIYFIDIKKIQETFIDDSIYHKRWLNLLIIFGGIFASIIPLFIYLFSGVPEQEGTLEMAASSLFLFSSLLLLFSFFRLNLENYSNKTAQVIRGSLLVGSVLLFLVFGEEISWGQHFFKWETPEVFQEANFQQETNLHNFFNPVFRYLYPEFGIGLLIFLSLIWFFPNNKPFVHELLFPPPSLFFVTVFLLGTSIIIEHETFEQIFGVFAFLYSLRIAICSNHLAKKPKLRMDNYSIINQKL